MSGACSRINNNTNKYPALQGTGQASTKKLKSFMYAQCQKLHMQKKIICILINYKGIKYLGCFFGKYKYKKSSPKDMYYVRPNILLEPIEYYE